MRILHRARALSLVSHLLAASAVFSFNPIANAGPDGDQPGHPGGVNSPPPVPVQNPVRQLAELRARLEPRDHATALRALHLALTRVPDGGTFLWQKKSRALKGAIRPIRAFRNAEGQICRHVVYALALGGYIKQIEGVACRLEDGSWHL